MSNQRRFSDEVLPSVFSRLDAVFPEFGWVGRGRGWVATNESFAHTRFGVRADRIICTDQRGYHIYGSGYHEHWLSYVNDGVFPSGDQWHRVARELAGRVSMKGFTSSREVSGWARLIAAAREQIASPGDADIRRYCEHRELPWNDWGLGAVIDKDALLATVGLSSGRARQERVLTSKPGEEWWEGRLVGGVSNVRGEMVGVWGRAIGPNVAKYVVSGVGGPLVQGALVGRPVVTCEGYLDALRLHAVSGHSVIAACGLCISEEVLELAAQASEVLIAFDGDAAGEQGEKRRRGG